MIKDAKDVWFVTQRKPLGFKATPVHRNGWLVLLAFAVVAMIVSAWSVTLVIRTHQVAMIGMVLLAMPFMAIGLISTIKERGMPLEDYLALKAKKS